MKYNIYYFIISLFITSCTSQVLENSTISEEENLFSEYSFIKEYRELDDSCSHLLSEMIKTIFIQSSTDSILSLYYLDADLFPKHYSKKENDKYEKYMVKIKKGDTTKLDFFVIKKNPCYLQVGCYIPEYDLLTIDNNMMYVNRFGFLKDCNAGNITDSYLEVDATNGALFSNLTYSTSNDSLFAVDSVYYSTNQPCFFTELDTFKVTENNQMKFTDSGDKINFEVDNYSLLFSQEKKSLRHWVVSDSHSHRILLDENKNYIFLSRIRRKSTN